MFMNSFEIKTILKNTKLKEQYPTQKYLLGHFTIEEEKEAILELKRLLNVNLFKAVRVEHIAFSYGIVIEINIGWGKEPFKLVFSGDCRPNESLIFEGRHCDLLIHECTFNNKMRRRAIESNHSIFKEAVMVSKKMKAKHTILTHFSKRYEFSENINEIKMKNLGFSFDFMSINQDNLQLVNTTCNLLNKLN